ncbi:MAG: 4,5-dioxygenase [Alphaproteobacteria bacterium]|nr:4,5-dioxygenase [Alphaproteobacteria bacterium]HCP01390.1 4,5-dioxygenase [Rhodospirillaceae bacterium]
MKNETNQHHPKKLKGFHAHIYYDADSKVAAKALREEIGARFDVELGRWHDKPIGPHPFSSYQVSFMPTLFGDIVPWLAFNRRNLVILVHPETGDDLIDHSDYAMWLGDSAILDLQRFRERITKR